MSAVRIVPLLIWLASTPLPAQECTFNGPKPQRTLTKTTDQVTRLLSNKATRPRQASQSYPPGSLDAYIFADLEANNINPAPSTTDWEFIRRVTLDLTG